MERQQRGFESLACSLHRAAAQEDDPRTLISSRGQLGQLVTRISRRGKDERMNALEDERAKPNYHRRQISLNCLGNDI
jgi:hypothetical protein